MQGTLWKWTNYWNGWQTRWFVLEDGILSYYQSAEDVIQGCKGSLSVQACEINVNSVDGTRLDLVIPGEQHIYLKAISSQERQKWLVALGTSKASQINSATASDSLKYGNGNDGFDLNRKKSELRMYCDLLMQQMHVIKTAKGAESHKVNSKALEEATNLLSVTCDTFINTLEECMQLAATATNSIPNTAIHPTNDIIVPPIAFKKPKLLRNNSADKKTPNDG